MIYTIYGYKVPHYIFFRYIDNICKKYNILDINDDDSEQIEEHKQFLKLNLRYCIEPVEQNSTFNYHKSIVTDLLVSIEELKVIQRFMICKKDEFIKTLMENTIIVGDVVKYVLIKYQNVDDIKKINFKTTDFFIDDENPNYDIIKGICIDSNDEFPLYVSYNEKMLSESKDLVVELFGHDFKEYKTSLMITNYD